MTSLRWQALTENYKTIPTDNACGMDNTYKSKIMVIGNGKDLYMNKVLLKEINNLKGQLQRWQFFNESGS